MRRIKRFYSFTRSQATTEEIYRAKQRILFPKIGLLFINLFFHIVNPKTSFNLNNFQVECTFNSKNVTLKFIDSFCPSLIRVSKNTFEGEVFLSKIK